MNYLLDTNIFIEAKRRYYGMDICPGFWVWLDNAQQADVIASISSVGDELTAGNDELAEWTHDRKDTGWFLDVSDTATQEQFIKIAAYVSSSAYLPEAKAEFLSGADPWLIAKAATVGAVVVTHEIYDAFIKRKIRIPNICREFGVSYLDTFDLLRKNLVSFVLS